MVGGGGGGGEGKGGEGGVIVFIVAVFLSLFSSSIFGLVAKFGISFSQQTRELLSTRKTSHITQTQQQRPESPTVTLTWNTSKYTAHKLQKRYIVYIYIKSWDHVSFCLSAVIYFAVM